MMIVLPKFDQNIGKNIKQALSSDQISKTMSLVIQKLNMSKESETISDFYDDMDRTMLPKDDKYNAVCEKAIIILMTLVSNQYKLSVPKLIHNSKKLDDMYDKINDVLANDKEARYRHRNDKIDIIIKYPVLVDKSHKKDYSVQLDVLGYDPVALMETVDNKIQELQSNNKTVHQKKSYIDQFKADLLGQIDQIYYDHPLLTGYTTSIKTITVKKYSLEKSIQLYKKYIETYYGKGIPYTIQLTSLQLQLLQELQVVYNRLMTSYGNNPTYKNLIESVCKRVLKYESISINYNFKLLDYFNTLLDFYSEQLQDIYKRIRS